MLVTLTYIHVILGAISVLSMALAWGTKKGSKLHRLGGKVFTLSLSVVILLGILLALTKDDLFLLFVGLFSAYVLCTGYCAAKIRHFFSNLSHRIPTALMLLTIIFMFKHGLSMLSVNNQLGVVLIFFSCASAILCISDLRFTGMWVGPQRINYHLHRMGVASIATITAIVVVNFDTDPAYLAWFLPGLVIGPIIYCFLLYNTFKSKQHPKKVFSNR